MYTHISCISGENREQRPANTIATRLGIIIIVMVKVSHTYKCAAANTLFGRCSGAIERRRVHEVTHVAESHVAVCLYYFARFPMRTSL